MLNAEIRSSLYQQHALCIGKLSTFDVQPECLTLLAAWVRENS